MSPPSRPFKRPVTPEVAGSSPVAPAFDTALLLAAMCEFVGRLEVAEERFSRLDGDDGATVLPDAIEQRCEQPTPFRRVAFDRPDAPEVREQLVGLVEPRIKRRPGPRQLVLERLATEHVLALRKIAHDVEVSQPLELPDELAPAHRIVIRIAGGAANRCEDRGAQLSVGCEIGDPVDELFLERLGACDRLVAAIPVAARRAQVAAHGRYVKVTKSNDQTGEAWYRVYRVLRAR